MNRSKRIWLNLNEQEQDKYIKFKLEQDIDTLEIMSLKIDTKEAYQDFNADYGVLIGRVTANNGIGVPNVRVSIFIPLAEEDENNGEIVSIYPYKTPRDKDKYGKRYNLLPRVSKIDPVTNIITPKQAFGSFPIKEELGVNDTYMEVYKKYYKYSTITNSSGDYMIFGVPTGTQIVHMSADITDIGDYSMTPASMITNLGYSPNFFDETGTKIKPSDDLEDLPHIETQEISVDVIPFWGIDDIFDIGITRQDFRIRATLVNTFVIFGSSFTDGENQMWGNDSGSNEAPSVLYLARGEIYRMNPRTETLGGKRTANITERIYYYPPELSGDDITTCDPYDDMIKLTSSEYSSYKRNGDFAFIISCNRNKVITSETGEKINVPDDYPGGVYTEFWGSMVLEYTQDDLPCNHESVEYAGTTDIRCRRLRYKFPQTGISDSSGGMLTPKEDDTGTMAWKREYHKFKAGKYYSISKFHPTVINADENQDHFGNDDYNGTYRFFRSGAKPDTICTIAGNNLYLVGSLWTGNYDNDQLPHNAAKWIFANNWLNFSVYFMQFGVNNSTITTRWERMFGLNSNTNTVTWNWRNSEENRDVMYHQTDKKFIGGDVSYELFGRNDMHMTEFIHMSREDVKSMYDKLGDDMGFTMNVLNNRGVEFTDDVFFSNAINSPLPSRNENGLKVWGNAGKNGIDVVNGSLVSLSAEDVAKRSLDTEYYFFRGYGGADCFQFLDELGLL